MSVRKAATAGLWSTIDLLMRQGVGFVVSVILARLLTPADFGVVSLLSFFSGLSIVFIQGGLSTALIQRQETTADEESSVFWWNLFGSAAFGAILLVIAPWVAQFYGYPVMRLLIPLVAGQIVFSALGAVQTALLTRALRFDRLMICGAVSSIASGVLGVAAAVWGAGIWALALQMTSLAALNTAILWGVTDWRPNRHMRLSTIAPLFGFGLNLSFSSALELLNSQGFALVIGKLHGVQELGLFNRAVGTQALPSNVIAQMVGRVALPIFAERAGDPAALKRGMRMAIRLSMLLNLPIMAGLSILAELVLTVLFGDKWRGAWQILSILSLAGIFMPLHIINLQLMLAQGRSDRYFRIEIIKKLVGIALAVAGSIFGITGLAWAILITTVLTFFINTWYTRRTIEYSAVEQLVDIAEAVAITGLMAGLVSLLASLLALPPLAKLAVLVSAGALVYGVLAFALLLLRWTELKPLVTWLLFKGTRDLPAPAINITSVSVDPMIDAPLPRA